MAGRDGVGRLADQLARRRLRRRACRPLRTHPGDDRLGPRERRDHVRDRRRRRHQLAAAAAPLPAGHFRRRRIALPARLWSAHPRDRGRARSCRRQRAFLDAGELDRRTRPRSGWSAAAHRRTSHRRHRQRRELRRSSGHRRPTARSSDWRRRTRRERFQAVAGRHQGARSRARRVGARLVLRARLCRLRREHRHLCAAVRTPRNRGQRVQLPPCGGRSRWRACRRSGEQARQLQPPCARHLWQHPVAGIAFRCDRDRARACRWRSSCR